MRGGWAQVGRRRQRVLTVAHLNDDKSDCRAENLAPLCQVCHLVTQTKIDFDTAIPPAEQGWLENWRDRAFVEMLASGGGK
jgi:hypothetical protein